ncbi:MULTISPECIES: methyl-accepting chemotaxis protein [unclassified Achromobacter]|uniref:methyl-accepting chemotaxis protein n=1 Tax=unclassified Achromobacter TaxID=2626865 RepID=UPI000B5187BB|nr:MULTISPECIES: methyl-accepting chemotaxis protein [unclassified Achromobacter]OWT80063.1 methyl-accepting chemotaxis protein [Achromobacter sp. HZ34]OWT81946.1 methyl-accepting chemotaxis protein [Achromobacter sp. HZ28]
MQNRLRINTALSAALVLFVLLFVIAGTGAVLMLRDTRAWVETLGRDHIERSGDLNNLGTAVFQARAALTDAKTYMEGGRMEDRDREVANAEKLLAQAQKAFARLRDVPYTDADGAALYAAVLKSYSDLADGCLAPMIKAIQGWNGIEVNRLSDKVLGPASTAFVKAESTFQVYARQRGAAAVSAVADSQNTAIYAALGLGLITIALAIGMRIFFHRAMLKPLDRAGEHFDRIANGDLTQAVRAGGSNEIGVLYTAMRRMQDGLTGAVSSVRGGVQAMHGGVHDIAQACSDMSDRSAGQAAALQEAAASMSELADTVHVTSENALQASQQSEQAADLAQRGGAAVEAVVESMREISTSARRIAEIVGVVDGIAFQTNILALNAAVEAARAGEQGRGFAVVAGEVRGLAQRSSVAAREIRDLIQESSARVDAGVRQVGVAGQTVRDMQDAAHRVSGIVREISGAASAQAQGVQVVNEAVGRIEMTTQETAALVQDTATAAGALRSQAEHLLDAVAVFRINELQNRGAGGARELGWNQDGAAHAAPAVVVGLVTA